MNYQIRRFHTRYTTENLKKYVDEKFHGNIEILSECNNGRETITCKCKRHNYIYTKTAHSLINGAKVCNLCAMQDCEDITGKKYGRLTAVRFDVENSIKHKAAYWVCKCDCGSYISVSRSRLKDSNTKSCGCLHDERIVQYNRTVKVKVNEFDLSGNYGVGICNNDGSKFYFDIEDYEKIKNYCWFRDSHHGYIEARDRENNRYIKLHRVVMGENSYDGKHIVDHINNDRTDNRKCNLRIVTRQENAMNYMSNSSNTSGVRGISKTDNRWTSYIGVNGRHIYLGSYVNFDDAVAARKEAEKKYFGEFAYNPDAERIIDEL